jgi:hypothetical protein
MAKLLLILLTAACLTAGAWAKPAPCNLDMAQSPVVRGIQLNMTREQAEQGFGQPIFQFFEDKSNDTATAILSSSHYAEQLKDLLGLNMKFFEGRLYDMQFTYASGSFANNHEAMRVFNQAWKLPDAWLPPQYGDSVMHCNGWVIVLRLLGGRPQVDIAVKGMADKVERRRKEKTGTGFKP